MPTMPVSRELLHECASLLGSLRRRHELRADRIDDSRIHHPLYQLPVGVTERPARDSPGVPHLFRMPTAQSATLIPWSSIQRTARWITRRSNRVFARSSSCCTASRY